MLPMSLQRTLLFFISLIAIPTIALAQEDTTTVVKDSITYNEKYGIRVGIDLAKPLKTLLDDDYNGLEILADYRVFNNYFLAAELGNETSLYKEQNLNAETKGTYFKIGGNYNAYNNWIGMSNEIFVGLRYGIAAFSQELQSYSIYTDSPYFEPVVVDNPIEYNGLSASWLELQLGIKTEVLKNIYLSVHVQLKRRLNQSNLENFDNLFIPGFGRTYDDSLFGIGYGYSISYLLPIYKKTKKEKNFGQQ